MYYRESTEPLVASKVLANSIRVGYGSLNSKACKLLNIYFDKEKFKIKLNIIARKQDCGGGN